MLGNGELPQIGQPLSEKDTAVAKGWITHLEPFHDFWPYPRSY
jgi:hypothetical protein